MAPAHFCKLVALWGIACLVYSGSQLSANDEARRTNAAYFGGLRSRRLYAVAERYALQQIHHARKDSLAEAWLRVELSQTYAEHASSASSQEQESLWKRAEEVVRSPLDANGSHPHQVLFRSQLSFLPAIQADGLCWELELAPGNPNLLTRAMDSLDQSIKALAECEQFLNQWIKAANGKPSKRDDELTSAELNALRGQVRFALAKVQLQRARLLKEGDFDQNSTLFSADQILQGLSGGGVPADVAWNSKLLRCQIARLRKDYALASGIAKALFDEETPPEIGDAAVCELIRVDLAQGRIDAAMDRFMQHERRSGRVSAELRAVHVETLLKARELALSESKQELARQLIDRAREHHLRIRGAWQTKTSHLLELADERANYGDELAEIVMAARANHANGRWADAARDFERAGDRAQSTQRKTLAAEFFLTAGSLFVKQEAWSEAASLFRKSSTADPGAPQAAEADLTYIFCLGKIQETTPSAEHDAAYHQALIHHRTAYANSPTQGEATFLLARWHEGHDQLDKAIELYRSVPAGHDRSSLSLIAITRCFRKRMQDADGRAPENAEAIAIHALTEIVAGFPVPPNRWNDARCTVALELARLRLGQLKEGTREADSLLEFVQSNFQKAQSEAQQSGQPLPSEWSSLRNQMGQLRIVSLAGRGKVEDARKILEELSEAEPSELLGVLAGLMEVARSIPGIDPVTLGELQLDAVTRLESRRGELNKTQQRQLDLCAAQANVSTLRTDAAIAIYERLIQGSPRDQKLLETVVGLLGHIEKRDATEKQYVHLRTLESLEKPGSGPWLARRYEIAVCLKRLGKVKDALKLISVTRVIYPQLGGNVLKSKFEVLETELKNHKP